MLRNSGPLQRRSTGPATVCAFDARGLHDPGNRRARAGAASKGPWADELRDVTCGGHTDRGITGDSARQEDGGHVLPRLLRAKGRV